MKILETFRSVFGSPSSMAPHPDTEGKDGREASLEGAPRSGGIPEQTPQKVQESPAVAPALRFDMASVLKSYQAISGEIVFASLLERLMQVVIENAGAQEGFLILNSGEARIIEAHITTEGGVNVSFPCIALEKSDGLLRGAVYYVGRTHESLVLDDAANGGEFALDPYVADRKPRSIMCIPIKRHDALMGVLYLENRDIPGAFTMERVEVLRLLSSQIAISVDNARLYNDLGKSEERYRTIIEDMDEAYVEFDAEGRMRFFNHGLCEMTGCPRSELERMNPCGLFDEENLGKLKEAFARVRATGMSEKLFECEMIARGGGRRHVQMSITPDVNKGDRAVGFRCVGRDVTVKKTAEIEMKRAKEQAEAASRAKSEFLSNISHEIRTPLNAIIGFSELVSREAPAGDALGKIRKAAGSLLEIVDDIMDYSEMESGRSVLSEEEFRIGDVMKAVKDACAGKAREKGLRFAARVGPNIPEALVGDPGRLARVLSNLADNGIKFTDQGGVEVDAQVDGELEDGIVLRFTITDTGMGIPEDKIPLLFGAFTQADGSLTRRHGGAGLGLAITRELVELMGGAIRVESTEGQGSSFIVTAGFKRAKAGDMPAMFSPDTSLKGIRVLVVEDNQLNQQVLTELLKYFQIVPEVAENGEQAVSMTRLARYDAVLMDIQMPVMDGYQATRLIREDARLSGMPIIAVTAHVMDEDRRKCLDAGMNDYLTKPIDTRKLLATLAKWVKPGEKSAAAMPVAAGDRSARRPALPKLPDSLPGIEVREALERMVGNGQLFLEMLKGFALSYRDAGRRIIEALEQGDAEEARRLAHTVKGVAGNISAVDLHMLAGELEQCIKKGESDRYVPLFSGFEHALQIVLESIATLGHLMVAQQEENAVQERAIDPLEVQPMLERLARLMGSNDVDAGNYLGVIMEKVGSGAFKGKLKAVEEHLGIYDFKGALKSLNGIVHDMGMKSGS